VQRQLPGLAELGLADGQHARVRVKVAAFQAERLAEPGPGGEQQPYHGLHRDRLPGRVKPARSLDQRGDIGLGIQIWHSPPGAAGQQASWRDLRLRVGGVQPAGEPADRRQPLSLPGPGPAGGLCGPCQRQLGRDCARARRLGEDGELLEQLAGPG
jgi:hypothetical protein